MKKEIVISAIIIIIVIIGNIITQNYTKKCAREINKELLEIKEIVNQQQKEVLENKIKQVSHNWDEMQEKLAFYIEHDELEKVETELRGLKGYIEKEEHTEALAELDKSIFILEHIKEKTSLNLKNIF